MNVAMGVKVKDAPVVCQESFCEATLKVPQGTAISSLHVPSPA